MIPVFQAKVIRGALHLMQPKRWKQWCQQFQDGEVVELIARRPRTRRSDRQNDYYWGVVLALISEHTGQPVEATMEDGKWVAGVHDFCKDRFLSAYDEFRDVTIIRSTTSLTTAEFEDYLSKIREWAASGQDFEPLYIPLPNEVLVPRVFGRAG